MSKPLILVGGGGHCKSVIEAAESVGRAIYGIIDLEKFVGTKCLGYNVIGTDEDLSTYVSEYDFLITLGFIKNPYRRIWLYNKVMELHGTFATIVASTAHVSKFAHVGNGTVILHGVNINAGASIGANCIINTGAIIEHDVKIGHHTHVSTGARINGDCNIANETFIGSGAIICNGVSVVSNSIVGAGAVVCRDITEAGTYVGVPAKRIK